RDRRAPATTTPRRAAAPLRVNAPRVDLHLHTDHSDGRLSPSQLVRAAADAGLTTIAVTDHDTTAGLAAVARAARSARLDCVPGIEITAIHDGRDIHVLAHFLDE